MRTALCLITVLGVVGGPTAGSPLRPGELMVAAFTLDNGWVSVNLRRESGPLTSCRIRVTDSRDRTFAEGDIDDDGRGMFPWPGTSECLVWIELGNRTADPIRLMKSHRELKPATVAVTFGQRPCCRPDMRRSWQDRERPSRVPWPEATLGVLCVGGGLLAWRRGAAGLAASGGSERWSRAR
ncbi:MAG: hypothetical protein NZ700_08580 [Gemmataceae bacterium]|nr:hypothetical protein [Gemmataceae bacterium]MDW8266342.1 hypothetical protein [Gemmataceae bacterium]